MATASLRCNSGGPKARSPSKCVRPRPRRTSSSSSGRETTTSSRRRVSARHLSRARPNLALGDEVYVGLFLCSHNSNVVEKAVFRDVRIIRPGKGEFRSLPRLHRQRSGNSRCRRAAARQIIHSSAQPFEAPNWTPDGRALIYNISGRDAEARGRLYRFDLATRQATLIDTDFATRNNNDHVLSFDGTMLAISHHSTNHGGRSAVFTLPVTGGTPEAHHAVDAFLSARLVAGREVAGLYRRPERRVRHLQKGRRWQRRRDQADRLQRAGRRPRVHAGREIHLLQFDPQRARCKSGA